MASSPASLYPFGKDHDLPCWLTIKTRPSLLRITPPALLLSIMLGAAGHYFIMLHIITHSERVRGVGPLFSVWKTEVITVIRYPRTRLIVRVSYEFLKKVRLILSPRYAITIP